MEFPATERVIYGSNPLTEVVFQVRFPRIFEIDERLPAEFQNVLGANYPFIETNEGVSISAITAGGMQSQRRTFYEFLTEDRSVSVHLNSEFLAVVTRRYERWEKFKEHIDAAIKALEDSYSVPIFTRVGLRYVDQISRNKLGISDERWSELIRKTALGVVSEDDIPISDVHEAQMSLTLQITSDTKALIRTGLTQPNGPDSEAIFVVDSDFFAERPIKGSHDALDHCSTFNQQAGRAFRWFITERLHRALDPRDP